MLLAKIYSANFRIVIQFFEWTIGLSLGRLGVHEIGARLGSWRQEVKSSRRMSSCFVQFIYLLDDAVEMLVHDGAFSPRVLRNVQNKVRITFFFTSQIRIRTASQFSNQSRNSGVK